MLSWHGRPAHVFRQKARTNFRAAAKEGGGAGILACLESVSGGHSCPPEPIRIRSAGRECPALADSGRQECLPHQESRSYRQRQMQGGCTRPPFARLVGDNGGRVHPPYLPRSHEGTKKQE